MPSYKCIMDGDRTWRSSKLRQVQPVSYRAEYTWMFPIRNDYGSFEYDPTTIWAVCYAAARPDITQEDVRKILAEFERVKLLFRFKFGNQWWGYWTGVEKPGLLPPPSQRYRKGPSPDPEELRKFLGEAYPETREGQGEPLSGFGFVSGLGSGIGSVVEDNAHTAETETPNPGSISKAFEIED
jgi:hypothetical protein